MSHPQARAKHAAQLQKTVMCRFYLAGNCRKGSACAYAHGTSDMRHKPDLACTSICPEMQETGNCTNPDCRYAHENSELRTTSMFLKSKFCMFAQRGRCKNGEACRFAHTRDEYLVSVAEKSFSQSGSSAMGDPRQMRNANRQGGTGGWPESDSVSGSNSSGRSAHHLRQQLQRGLTPETSSSQGTSERMQPDSLAPMSTPEGTSDEGSSDGQQKLKSQGAAKADTGGTSRIPQNMENATSMIMMNIPPFLTQGSLVSLLEDLSACMCGTFDFFYCPWDPSKDSNLGYAVVNFFSAESAFQFEQEWSKKYLLAGCRGSKRLRIMPASIQGREANIRFFAEMSLARHANPRFRPLFRASLNDPLRPVALVSQDDSQHRADEWSSASCPASPPRQGLQPGLVSNGSVTQPPMNGQGPFIPANPGAQNGMSSPVGDMYNPEMSFVRQYPPMCNPDMLQGQQQPWLHAPAPLLQAHGGRDCSAPPMLQQDVQWGGQAMRGMVAPQRTGYCAAFPQGMVLQDSPKSPGFLLRKDDTGYFSEYSD